jgi:hypothetical protein
MKTATTNSLTINGRPATREGYKRIFGTLPVAKVVESVDEEYEQWKRANGLSQLLSREAYNVEFRIYAQ